MIQVFEARHLPEAHFVAGLLEADGIPAEIRGDTLFSTLGTGISVPGVLPTVWIPEGADAGKAIALVATYSRAESRVRAEEPAWTCPACMESHEPQFSACWKCGAARPPES